MGAWHLIQLPRPIPPQRKIYHSELAFAKLFRVEFSAWTRTREHLLRTSHREKLWFSNLKVRHDIHCAAPSPYPTTFLLPPTTAKPLACTTARGAPQSTGVFSLKAGSDDSAVVCEKKMRYGVVFADDAVKQSRSILRVSNGYIDAFSQ